MSRKLLGGTQNEEQSDGRSSNSKKVKELIHIKSRRKLLNDRNKGNVRYSSYSSSSIITSLAKLNEELQPNRNPKKPNMLPQFTQKYLHKGATPQQIYQQMLMVLTCKQRDIQTTRVYRDQLKFISYSSPYSAPMKVSLKLLQDKSQLQSKMRQQKRKILDQLKNMDIQNKNVKQYTKLILDYVEECNQDDNMLDMGKEKEIMVDNIKKETNHLVKELQEEKRKNNKEIRHIQDQILDLRIAIKEKQDKIRELKAKICTHYIKMHSRNSSGSRSKDKNMSMSVRKFNTAKNQTIRQVFIGNTQFKNFSKEIIEKVEDRNDLIKIDFYSIKDKLIFRCIYENKEGKLHSYDHEYKSPKTSARNESQKQQKEKQQNLSQQPQSIFVKYLMSIKFFFKSSLVGVQCRIKTQKGNKHIQIGNCQPQVQYQLVTLVNRKLMTLGSYWHAKEMIGVSVWFVQEGPTTRRNEDAKRSADKEKEKDKEREREREKKRRDNANSFEQYFT